MLCAARTDITLSGEGRSRARDSATAHRASAGGLSCGGPSDRKVGRGAPTSCHRLRQQLHIVRGADQAPFALDLLEPPQQKLPEAAPVLDDPEDGFHRALAQPVPTAPAPPLQPPPHCRHQRATGAPAGPRGTGRAVPLASGGDVGSHVPAGPPPPICPPTRTRAGGEPPGRPPRGHPVPRGPRGGPPPRPP